MSGIGSTLRRRWVEVAWGVFAAANVTAIVLMSRWETIPFHFVWVSLTLVYGFRHWRFRTTMLLLLVVIASTGVALAVSIRSSSFALSVSRVGFVTATGLESC